MTIQMLFDAESIRLFAEANAQAHQDFETEEIAAARDSVEILREPLAQYPVRPTYPIHWDSDLQRRALFASQGFGAGIPTERTGGIPGSWTARQWLAKSIAGSTVYGSVSSNVPGIPYVQDRNRQSMIHAGRWLRI